MKLFLKILFSVILIYMLTMTAWVSMHKSIFAAAEDFSWTTSPWAVATLFDAYFGFITFYVWVAYKERTWVGRALWFVLVMALGNIAMSSYVLVQLFKLRPEQPASTALLRSSS